MDGSLGMHMSSLVYEKRTRIHLQVRDRIRNMIATRGLRRGDPLPAYREMTGLLGVSLVTVQRAMDELTKEGVVRGWPGRGTVVGRDLTPSSRRLAQAGAVFYCTRHMLFSSAYLMEILQGVMLEAEAREVDVRVFSIKNEGGLTARQIAESGVDGALLVGVANDAYIAGVARECRPLVVADYRTAAAPADCVVCDNEGAVGRLMEHLSGMGHRRVAYLDGWSTDTVAGGRGSDPVIETSDIVERREAYLRATASGFDGEAAVYRVPGDEPHRAAQQAVAAWAASARKPTAVAACDAGGAAALIREFRKAGVRVPQDVSVVGVAGAGSEGQDCELPLTYCRMHFVEMGRKALRLLSERCRKPQIGKSETHRVSFDFVRGGTAAPRR